MYIHTQAQGNVMSFSLELQNEITAQHDRWIETYRSEFAGDTCDDQSNDSYFAQHSESQERGMH